MHICIAHGLSSLHYVLKFSQMHKWESLGLSYIERSGYWVITQYDSTVYIGIAIYGVVSHTLEIQFLPSVSSQFDF